MVLLALPAPGRAQQLLVGVVSDRETAAPLVGVYVVLEVPGEDNPVAAVLTDATGRFVVTATPGDTYRIRAERVGLATEVTDWFTFRGDAPPREIAMSERALELAGLTVNGRVRTCRLGAAEAAVVQRWWDEVRKALQATAFVEQQDLAGLRFERFERAWSSNLHALRQERVLPPDSAPSRPFLSPDAETLSQHGFVQGERGHRLFLGPDAAVLFSTAFLQDHCLGIAPPPGGGDGDAPQRAGTLRLAVEPTRSHPPDIRGTLEVDTLSGELRSFDFTYANLPRDLPRSEAGGHLTFQYLPSGAWIVSDWWIRMPQIQYVGGGISNRGSVPAVAGYVDRGGRVIEAEGSPLAARSGGATLRGVVFDSLSGRPLAGARVSLVDARYATRTGPDGHFTLTHVPPGRHGLTFHHVSLSRMGIPSPVVGVDVAEGASDSVALTTPGFSTTATLLCAGSERAPITVLTGRVTDPSGGSGASAARVRARWVTAGLRADGGRSMRAEGRAGLDGHYVLCGLPAGVPVALAVRTDSSTWRDGGSVELAPGRIVVRDLRPGTEADATVRGAVRSAEGGQAIPGAAVRVLAVTGDTVAWTRAGPDGTFQVEVPPGVGYRAVAAGDGYVREASDAFSLDGAQTLDVAFELMRDPGGVAVRIEGLQVQVTARNHLVARRLLMQYGQSETRMGRRWIGLPALDSMPSVAESDPGVAIQRRAMPGVWVDEAAKHGKDAILCVQQRGRRCSIVVLDGMRIDLSTALLVDFHELEGIAVLSPEDATTFFGTEAGGGAILLWTRGSGRR